jgi:hypothetical protein
LFSLAFCIVVLGLFLTMTNPDNVSIGLLVIPVVLLFFIAFCASQLFLYGFKLLEGKTRKRRVVALISSSFITVTMILQSTGGVSAADVLLLGLIISVLVVYIDKF